VTKKLCQKSYSIVFFKDYEKDKFFGLINITFMVAIWPFLKRFAKKKMIKPFGHF